MSNQKIKVVENFAWLLITEKAKDFYLSGLFDGSIYALYDVDSETEFCETYEDLTDALERGLEIGVELGFINEPKPKVVEWYNDLMNLDVTSFRNLDPIMEAKTDEEWIKAGQKGIPAWCYYENDEKHNARFGKLYNWHAVNDKRGLAPEGYRIPTIKELDALKVLPFYLVPAGWRNHAKTIYENYFTSFEGLRKNGFFWSSSQDNDDSELAWHRYFTNYCDTDSLIDVTYKSLGASVICIKD